MSKRLKEIEVRIAELKALQKPLYTEEFELDREKKRIHAQSVKEIALRHNWILLYDDNRERFYLEPEWTDPHVRKKIYEHTEGSYHHSFEFEKDEYETVKLYIDDGDVVIHFSNTEMFKKYAFQFKIDTSRIGDIKKALQEKMDVLSQFDEGEK